jgi:hypothetical protein
VGLAPGGCSRNVSIGLYYQAIWVIFFFKENPGEKQSKRPCLITFSLNEALGFEL